MDIFPRTAQAAHAVKVYLASVPAANRTAVDCSHRCTTACKYVIPSSYTVAVCAYSLHTHVCGADVCTLGVVMQDTTRACRITGLELRSPAEQQHISIRTPGSFNKSSTVHWSTPTRRVRTPAGKILRASVANILHRAFMSEARRDITGRAVRTRDVAGRRAAVVGGHTYWTYSKVRAVVDVHYEMARDVPLTVPATLITYLCDATILLKSEGVKRKLSLTQNASCVVYGLLQLLACGFSPGGVDCIRRIEYVHRYGLTPSQYAKLPGLRARQQTIAVRQIQRICVDEDGRAVVQLPKYFP